MKNSYLSTIVFGWLLLSLIVGTTSKSEAGTIHPSVMGPSRFITAQDSLDVWIIFTDRGYQTQESLISALEKAENNLLPANRARRQKVRSVSLVDEKDLPVSAGYVQAILDQGCRFRTVSRYINAVSVRVPFSKLRILADFPFVAEVRAVAKGRRYEPDIGWNISLSGFPQTAGLDELDYGPSYNQLNQINVVAVHDSGYSGEGVLVCLLDTGFFTDHEALVNQPVLAEWDFINNDPETQNEPGDRWDQHNHGTYTFSTLGGAHDGDLYGPAYGATFIIGKTESVEFEQPIEEDWYVAGLEWADSLGAQVVSTSLGYFDWYTFADLDGNTAVTTIGVDAAVANGIICVTAAGNERNTSWGHIIAPADADSVIAVGAVNSSGTLATFSSPGPTYDGRIKPEVCARGVETWCAVPAGGQTNVYGGVGGTSLSTPLVGGSCALILEAHPDWTPMQVREALMNTASNAENPNNDYGWGIIDVLAAINYNFPPTIIQRHPLAGTFIAFQDTLQDFWVSAEDYEGDQLLYHWRVDSQEIYSGFDSTFRYQWSETGIATVKVVVEDSHRNSDSTSWTVQIEAATGIEIPSMNGIPADFSYDGNFPNPFNPTTSFRFDLPQAIHVHLSVFDLNGRLVKSLINAKLDAGTYVVSFDASGLASGIYFSRLLAGDYHATSKLVLTK